MEEIRCANCGIVIRWQPTVVNGEFYCCVGCSQGGPCTCDYSNLPKPGEVKSLTPVGSEALVRKPTPTGGANPPLPIKHP